MGLTTTYNMQNNGGNMSGSGDFWIATKTFTIMISVEEGVISHVPPKFTRFRNRPASELRDFLDREYRGATMMEVK